MKPTKPIPAALLLATVGAMLAACGTVPRTERPSTGGASTSPPVASSKYYKDDGPGENPPANLDAVPDAVPRLEPLNRFANRPYVVLGREYVPATSLAPYRERGVASWYGRKFHGQKTSTGELYDMYGMTAAHPTLPLPSYARVTNTATGRSVIVRVNDRGPFLHNRVIDLSYAAAHRLGIAQNGSGEVEVEAILPDGRDVVAVALPPVTTPPVAPVATPPSSAAPATQAVTTAIAPSPAIAATNAAPQPEPAGPGPASGYVVQLGAFANFANAQAFLAHVQNQTASAQVEARVRETKGLYRVYVGPYADRDEARRVAERIAGAFGLATTVTLH